MCDSCEAYLKNWHILLSICETDRVKFDSTIRNKRSVEELGRRLKKLNAAALGSLQMDSYRIADAVTV